MSPPEHHLPVAVNAATVGCVVVNGPRSTKGTTMTLRRWCCAAAVMVLMAACGGQETGAEPAAEEPAAEETAAEETAAEEATTPEEPEASEETSAPAAAEAATAAAVTTTATDLGEVLADDQGRVLYVFDNDSGGESSCYEDCAANWPPLVGEVEAGEGVDAALLGTTERTDGETQVTYGDRPLYYFAGDEQPGDTNGQGAGDVWWVVGPDGEAITGEAAAAGSGESY